MYQSRLPIAYGWYGIAYSGELDLGRVKPLFYMGKHLLYLGT